MLLPLTVTNGIDVVWATSLGALTGTICAKVVISKVAAHNGTTRSLPAACSCNVIDVKGAIGLQPTFGLLGLIGISVDLAAIARSWSLHFM